MGLTVRNKGGANFEPIPEGVHIGVCYGVYDLGTHYDERWNKTSRKVRVNWELQDCRITIEKDGKKLDLPRAIGQTYTASLSEKANLRKDLEAWRGKSFTEKELDGFDMQKLAGAACQIQVINTRKNDKTYSNVAGIMALPKGMKAPKLENEFQWFSFEEGTEIPDGVPPWIVDIIKGSQEWSAQHGNAIDDGQPDGYDDEPPVMPEDAGYDDGSGLPF